MFFIELLLFLHQRKQQALLLIPILFFIFIQHFFLGASVFGLLFRAGV